MTSTQLGEQTTESPVTTTGPATPPAARPTPASETSGQPPLLGTTCEITSRFREFALFWRENPVSARFALQTEARSLLPKERVKNCLRVQARGDKPVDVLYAPAVQKPHYGNLQTCASVWACPVCAAKLSTRKLEELQLGIAHWEDSGNTVLMATFTLQHLPSDTCAAVLQALKEAHQKFWGNRPGQRIAKGFKIRGKVRGLEVTYTANGWHWHFHVLLFIAGQLPPNEHAVLKGEMNATWQQEVSKVRVRVTPRQGEAAAERVAYADNLHGFDLQPTNGYVGEYFTKHGHLPKERQWSEAHEVAMSQVKRAAQGGYAPFHLLALSLVGSEQAGQRFAEYALTGKGSSQLHWSRGLRALVGLTEQEKTDEEILAEQDQTAVLLAQLEREHWQAILGNAARGDLLKVAATGNPWRVLEFLEDLGLNDVYLPGLVNDPNYFGPHRIYDNGQDSLTG